jgi:hypothetical protein
MAMNGVAVGGNVAVTTTAQRLDTALSLDANKHFSKIVLKYGEDATATSRVYFGNSDVVSTGANAHGQLGPGDDYEFGSRSGWVVASNIYFSGSLEGAANLLFVNCEE